MASPCRSRNPTLLRLIAGLERPDAGSVFCAGEAMAGVPPHRRGFGLMFQDYALFPHQDVAQNVAFGLEMQKVKRSEVARRVDEALALVGLAGYAGRRVFDLSGGEQQRVALARCLAPQPRLLMLDEPLGSLDRSLREQLLDEVGRILRRVEVTAIYVTHDQQEAFALADRVVILRAGRIVQVGTPEDVYCHPADAFVAHFLGLPNLILGRAVAPGRVETALGVLTIADRQPTRADATVTVLVRPEAATLAVAGQAENIIRGHVRERSFRGGHHRVQVVCGDVALDLDLRPLGQALPGVGEEITLSLEPAGLSLLAD